MSAAGPRDARLLSPRFFAFLTAQFLGAANDNAFKMTLTLFVLATVAGETAQLRFNGLATFLFPLPFLGIVALGALLPLPVAFKLFVAAGPLLLPIAAFLAFRLQRVAFPGPLLGATAATVFLFVEEHPIWGGTLASVFTGELAYAYGLALALVFLAAVWRARVTGRSAPGEPL